MPVVTWQIGPNCPVGSGQHERDRCIVRHGDTSGHDSMHNAPRRVKRGVLRIQFVIAGWFVPGCPTRERGTTAKPLAHASASSKNGIFAFRRFAC